ncbi:ABC transporter permease [Pelistega europaea]|uniref:Iron ABC transporter permease n=1 Tax=Pelistega europaea TaxID=106147 RepID=A0A7Y4L9Y8_9BURK|nr:iron ABC transporter permease [Pelistega europaea]NOL49685.1 iron ABC transporter permease [Pelistega europaea]
MPLQKNNRITFTQCLGWLIVFSVIAPVFSLFILAISGNFGHWDSLIRYVLPYALNNTAILLIGTGIMVGLIGTGAAWLTCAYQFPTRNLLVWALLLPLAIPTYIMAFAYLDLLHPLGPIQTVIRELLGYESPRQFRLPDLRGMPGAIFVMGMALYPYVYLNVRVMFMSQSANLVEAARTLGCTPTQTFYRLILPMARPAIVVGISLTLLETLNDIGASEFLGIKTLTVSIYTEWVTRSNLAGASQIAIFMLFIVTFLIYIERLSRQRQRYTNTQRLHPIQPIVLTGYKAFIALCLGWLPVVVGFAFPALYLISETIKRLENVGAISNALWHSTVNTVTLAAVATIVTVIFGVIIAWVVRQPRFRYAKSMVRLGSLGYAIPGSVLAIGLVTPLVWIDNGISAAMSAIFSLPPQLYIMGSIAGLVIAYYIRFLTISIGSTESGYTRIPISLDQAARSLRCNDKQVFTRVHWPLLKPALGAAALLVFVDAMKELSATLLLRPLNFETLSTWLYAEAARGTYEEGAIAALLIVLVGLVPVIFLAKTQFKT